MATATGVFKETSTLFVQRCLIDNFVHPAIIRTRLPIQMLQNKSSISKFGTKMQNDVSSMRFVYMLMYFTLVVTLSMTVSCACVAFYSFDFCIYAFKLGHTICTTVNTVNKYADGTKVGPTFPN